MSKRTPKLHFARTNYTGMEKRFALCGKKGVHSITNSRGDFAEKIEKDSKRPLKTRKRDRDPCHTCAHVFRNRGFHEQQGLFAEDSPKSPLERVWDNDSDAVYDHDPETIKRAAAHYDSEAEQDKAFEEINEEYHDPTNLNIFEVLDEAPYNIGMALKSLVRAVYKSDNDFEIKQAMYHLKRADR